MWGQHEKICKNIMEPTKAGQIVKFHTPLSDEDHKQLFVVLEIFEDEEKSRADIKALNTGLPFPPVNKVKLSDLEVVKGMTNEFLSNRLKIGEYIKTFRKQKGFSQFDLAIRMNVSRTTISKIENGKFAITVDYLEKLSKFLDFDLKLIPR
jgi:DNA-binding XRE family transcriptional regulator